MGLLQRLRSLMGRGELAGLDEEQAAIVRAVQPYTMTSPRRIAALVEAVRRVEREGVAGAFAECGVWKGGSVMAMILTLQRLGRCDRQIWLYDTFEGMTRPTGHDTTAYGAPALDTWAQAQSDPSHPWRTVLGGESAGLEGVRRLLLDTGYPADQLVFVKGPVEQTLPLRAPESLALLRLDTDWYESTLHELSHLYPRLRVRGALIIDDYGHWDGCRRAVDEYLARPGVGPLRLDRIDYTGRIAVKT